MADSVGKLTAQMLLDTSNVTQNAAIAEKEIGTLGRSINAADASGKQFTITINRTNTELEGAIGPLREAVRWTKEMHEANELSYTEKSAAAQKAAGDVQEENAEMVEQLGIVESLKIAIDNLKASIDQATDPEDVRRWTKELRTAELQLKDLEGKGMVGVRRETEHFSMAAHKGSQALLGLSFIANALISDVDGASESQKRLSKAFTEGTNTATGMMFTLQMAGGALAAYALPISAAIGLLAALSQGFRGVDEASRKASEQGLKEFTDRLKNYSEARLEAAAQAVRNERTRIEQEMEAARAAMKSVAQEAVFSRTGTIQEFKSVYSKDDQARLDDFNRQKQENENIGEEIKKQAEYAAVRNRIERDTDKIIQKSGTDIEKINAQLRELNRLKARGDLFEGTGKRTTDEIARLEEWKANLLKTSADMLKDRVANAEQEYRAHQISHGEFKAILAGAINLTETQKERLGYQAKYVALLDEEQRMRAEQIQREIEKGEREYAERMKVYDLVQSMEKDSAGTKLDAIEVEYQQRRKFLTDHNAEKSAFDALDFWRLSQINEEKQKQLDKEVKEEERADKMRLSNAEKIANVLERAFTRSGDTLVGKMLQALQLAIQIEKALAAQKKTKGGGDGILDFLPSIFGLFAGFAGGGYTGSGSGDEPAGIAHKGEVYFEKPLVDAHGDELLELRTRLQAGMSVRDSLYAMTGTGGSLGANDSAVIGELRALGTNMAALSRTVAGMEIQQPIIFQNLLDGQELWRRNDPKYREYLEEKLP